MYKSPFLKKKEEDFPEVKEKNEGKFTAWAKKNGFKDACSAASAVMKDKDNTNLTLSKWLTTPKILAVKENKL